MNNAARSVRWRTWVRAGWLACVCVSVGASGQGPGVRGHVTLSPACGGAQASDSACRAPYADGQLDLVGADGTVVASTRTGSDGAYDIAAPAGRYHLKLRQRGKLPRCPSPQLEIGAGARTVVNIECDSGLR